MARISYVEKEQAPPEVQTMYAEIEKGLGMVPNIFRAAAHAPAVLQVMMSAVRVMQSLTLKPTLRELAYLTTSRIHGCHYWLAHHTAVGRKVGITEEQIRDLATYAASPAFSDVEKAAMRYAKELARTFRSTPETVAQVRQHLSEPELVELNFTVGVATMMNRFNESFAIDLEH